MSEIYGHLGAQLVFVAVFPVLWIFGRILSAPLLLGRCFARGFEPLFGFGLFTYFLSLYFIFNISVLQLGAAFVSIVFIIFFSVKNKILTDFSFSEMSTDCARYLVVFLILSIPSYLYGENFYVFRGNTWDAFNYATMAVGYSKYYAHEFPELIIQGNHLSYISNLNLTHRPSVVMVPAFLLSIFKIDIFSVLYFYKVFLLALFGTSLARFMEGKGLSAKLSTFLSTSASFSYLVMYALEIDALSQLAFAPFVVFWLYAFGNIVKSNFSVSFTAFLVSVSLMIYPEYGSLLIVSSFLFFIPYSSTRFDNFYKSNIFKKYIYVALLSAILILPFYEQTFGFLLTQLVIGFTSSVDWWGYFGSFVLGVNSPVTDANFVAKFQDIYNETGFYAFANNEVAPRIFSSVMYVLPSVFGLFQLTWSNSLSLFSYIILVPILFIFFNFCWRKSPTLDAQILRAFFIHSILLGLVFLCLGQLWSVLKLYTYCALGFLISFGYLLSGPDISKIKKYIVYVYFILMSTFPLYKYSQFNSGIGRLDGFPSILDPTSKQDFVWSFDAVPSESCPGFVVVEDNVFFHHFLILHLEAYGIPYVSSMPLRESYGVGAIVSMPSAGLGSEYCEL